MTIPISERRRPDAAEGWLRAEAGLGPALARAAAAFARLDERAGAAGPGAARRLAFREAADMTWGGGARLTADRLALYDALHLSGAGEDGRQLALAHWAFRRLLGGPPGPGGDLAAFLDRRPGPDLALLAERWEAGRAAAAPAMAPTRAAAAFFAWRALAGPEDSIEAAVIAARIGGAEGRHLCFLPAAGAAASVYRAGGSDAGRLAAWYAAVEAACLRHLMEIDRLAAWRARAGTAAPARRTEGRLLAALAAAPALSAPAAARVAGISEATARRGLLRLAGGGLVREMTGQGRFRLWQAAL